MSIVAVADTHAVIWYLLAIHAFLCVPAKCLKEQQNKAILSAYLP